MAARSITLLKMAPRYAAISWGADGYRSIVRRQQFPGEEARYSGYTCYRSVVSLVHRAPAAGNGADRTGTWLRVWAVSVWNGPCLLVRNAQPARRDQRLCLGSQKGTAWLPLRALCEPFVQVLHATPESAIVRHDVTIDRRCQAGATVASPCSAMPVIR